MKHVGMWRLRRVVSGLFVALFCAGAFAENAAIKPEPRPDDWWQTRHRSMNEQIAKGGVDMILIGDSITHGWEGAGKAVWDKYYAPRKAVNLGISGDRTQHVLWRLDNGNIAGISPKLAVVMIGTNNCVANTPEEIAEGIAAIVKKLRDGLPSTKILLLAVFPREEKPGELRAKLGKVNEIIARLDDGKMIRFLDIGPKFLEADGTLPKSIMPDALHPNEKGYEIWAQAIEPVVAELMGEIEKK
ncbi:MAG TPA: platelet-activating factor acetylhydrolase IB subunit [Candidatus Hydrogenedentes bacterium]|nr:platelet-activating factor acetylhydrolase IB subunit [Candidatus Hydrogenedentota bacterium]HOV73198.1 platelet-activating factor acetylhydrolase IB subunit [Candidatus Hydrogenedentota bacterium]HPC16770.1 platelet-activating factor acetylhydrolase IB subunit [Candidatus Hydrogenedentota bacterium]HRT18489.1 platelet-activating factor acetylhydrolase IB subunit [Candidatus Hydrogenedentota bacterium]HRT63508.1 platelet-activating factor acetylhydrolase IB subunit [Candidatus Hydrogenedento